MIEPDRLTPQWISEHVDSRVELDSAIDRQVIGDGEGLLGRIYQVCYQAEEPRSFVLKLPPPKGSTWDHLLSELEIFPREAQTYRLFGKAGACGAGWIPKCYWSCYDAAGSGALALEDLTVGCGFTATAPGGLSRAQAEATVETLAHLHALHASAGGPGRAERPPADWLYTARSDPLIRILKEALREGVPLLAERGASEHLLTALSRCDVEDVLEESHRSARLLSICHGDVWTNNVMFVPGREKAVILDWQFTTWGNPLIDLSFLLVSSLCPEHREAWSQALVERYHEVLREDLDPTIPYDLEDCQRDFELALPFGVLMSLCNVEAFLASVDEPQVDGMVQRLEAASHLRPSDFPRSGER